MPRTHDAYEEPLCMPPAWPWCACSWPAVSGIPIPEPGIPVVWYTWFSLYTGKKKRIYLHATNTWCIWRALIHATIVMVHMVVTVFFSEKKGKKISFHAIWPPSYGKGLFIFVLFSEKKREKKKKHNGQKEKTYWSTNIMMYKWWCPDRRL